VKVVVPHPELAAVEGPDDIPMAKTYPAGTFEISDVPNGVVTDAEPPSIGKVTEIPADPPSDPGSTVVEPSPAVAVAEPEEVVAPAPSPALAPSAAPAPAPSPAPAPGAKAGADKASLETLISNYKKKLVRNERNIDAAKGNADKMQSLHTRATLDLAAFTRKWYASNREAAGTMEPSEAKELSDRFLSLSERSETLLNQFKK